MGDGEAIVMNLRHQQGHLRYVERKNGPTRWKFLWRETDNQENVFDVTL